ncbi:ABC transporter permease [Chryseomicrobium palamuruense]|uniref:ABC transporter permease n=1 Tax=Chryseomicrobium palamuruense TaxID=682973 RepID=A0ABV8UYG8_9BACL
MALSSWMKELYIKNARQKRIFCLQILLALPLHLVSLILYLVRRPDRLYRDQLHSQKELVSDEQRQRWFNDYYHQERAKNHAFQLQQSDNVMKQQAQKLTDEQEVRVVEGQLLRQGIHPQTYASFTADRIGQPPFFWLTLLLGLPLYAFLAGRSQSFAWFILGRLVQTLFVIVGVATLVFTILYISPLDPARNILGVESTPDQVANFNRIYGLDQPYLVQLRDTLVGLFTFDLGTSFAGKENIAASIASKFPVTLVIALFSLAMAIAIAIPAGIVSALRPNSYWDYTLMIVALIGLSIPSFWQGLLFILGFSIHLQWFPAIYSTSNWLSLVLPVAVLGTSIAASIARMTRSSMLEVIHEDYIVTAKAKGLTERQIVSKHALKNAMIPIITVIGLLFGGMLGGAAITEKVFNISGIGSYIVDKQFIPDIPALLGGVVYIAIAISLVNLFIDILYAFYDPRIRSTMKKKG